MFKKMFSSSEDIAPFILRLTAGIVVIAHGFQKLFGVFGGHGPYQTMESFNQWFGFPYFITALVILSDFLGSLFLILGLLTRFMAASIAFVMLGAVYFVHGRWGFFMNWYAEPRGEGFEFHLLVLGIMTVLIIKGCGKFGMDNVIANRIGQRVE